MSCDSNCFDTLNITITEPSPISLSAVVVDESAAGAMDGSIDLSASGGTPCATNIQLGTATTVSPLYGFSAALFYTWYMDNKSELTFQASELAALGLQVGQSLSSIGWEMATVPGPGTVMNNLSLDVTEAGVTTNVYLGNYSAIVGWNDFAFSNPVVWNGGDIVITSCHDNSSYSAVNSYYYTVTPFVSVSWSAQDNSAGSITSCIYKQT
jgi:hypothetical protein